MGSADGPANERPVHEVAISRSFYLQKTEVTQIQWESVMGSNPSYFNKCGRTCPADKVSWELAQLFLQRLNSLTGKNYRLPTEAEWEYAARAGTTGDYGGAAALEMGWYNSNASITTHPVAQKLPNAWGIYDMHGNVREWAQDWYLSDYYLFSPSADPSGPPTGSWRVERGGSWNRDASNARSSYRGGHAPSDMDPNNGLRLVRTN